MKRMLFMVVFILTIIANVSWAQPMIKYDYMETWTWAGLWSSCSTCAWATNVSVTPTQSAVIYGTGTSTSANEQASYSLPNVTGLNPTHIYQFNFRVGSYSFTAPTASTKGLDVADILEVQVSTNGGVTYITELRLTGNSNAIWPYSATGAINHTANGVWNNSAAPTGDIYTSPAGVSTTGYSSIALDLPVGTTQVAVKIFCRVNSAGEEWWLDNIQLIDILPLPIELYKFEGKNEGENNIIQWTTASEHNNDYFTLERSTNGVDWVTITTQKGAGESTSEINYSFRDATYENVVNYYRLTQTDFNGESETFDVIAINNLIKSKEILYVTNEIGQIVDEHAKGFLIVFYSDYTTKKIYR